MPGSPPPVTTATPATSAPRRLSAPVERLLDRHVWDRQGDLRPLLVLAIVIAARAIVAWEWLVPQELGLGDVPYYWSRTAGLAEAGLAETLREYPTPVAWLLAVPHVLGGHSQAAYAGLFIMLIGLADLGFCALLWASGAVHRGRAIALWSVLCAALGPLIWLRFDLLPAVLVGAAAVLAARRPATAGGLLAAGAATKLWPALLFPLLVNRPAEHGGGPAWWRDDRHRWLPPLVGFGLVGVVVVAVSLAAGGWARLVSPLVWQSDRGLQIEAIVATVPMVLRAVNPATWSVQMSHYQAFEVFGPGVDHWLTVADVAALAGLALGIAAVVVHWRRRYADAEAWAAGAAVAMLGLVCLLIVTNKTFSPQYVIWLGGPLAALVAWRGPGVPQLTRWSVGVLLLAASTHLVYPVLYDRINGMADDPVWTPWATVVLVVRNLLAVALTVDVLRHCLRARHS